MKKIFAVLLAAAMLFALAACAGSETETTAAVTSAEETTGAEETTEAATEADTSEEVTTEEVTTEEVTTEETTEEVTTEEVTTEEVTTEEVTTEEVTTEEVTTEEVTTEEVTTEEVTTEEVTTEAVTQPDEAVEYYEFAGITLTKPSGYTFKDFSGLPSGLKNGTVDGTCFFNFGTIDAAAPMTEDDVTPFLDGIALSLPIGAYTFDGFKSYEVSGHTVTKLDYSWENRAIIQSVVRVHFEDYTIVINFATLPTIPEGVTDFNTMIDSMTIG